MDQHDRLLALLQDLYAAPGSPERWQVFLDRLCDALNGSAANFISHDFGSNQGRVALTSRTDPEALRAYLGHWRSEDPWAYSPQMRPTDSTAVLLGDELIPHSDFTRTAFCAEFARRYDILRCIAGVIEVGPHRISVVSINGSEGRGPFGSEDAGLLNALMPHLKRALQLHRRLAAADAHADGLAHVIDGAAQAVLLIDRFGYVTYMNRAAADLVQRGDGLVVERRALRGACASDTSRLRALLADAIATSVGEGCGAGGVLALGRPSGRRPLMLLVSPLPGRGAFLADVEPPAAIITVTDPDRVEIAGEGTLRSVLGLTPAEAKLARLLARGATLEEVGGRLGLRIATLRTRLKAIFEKTDTHRQADLVRLILLLPHS